MEEARLSLLPPSSSSSFYLSHDFRGLLVERESAFVDGTSDVTQLRY